MPSSLRRALGVLIAAALLVGGAAADIVHLKTGKAMESSKLSEDPNGDVTIRMDGGGSVLIKRDQVEWVELSDKNAAKEEILKRRKPGTAAAFCDAAAWAAYHGMKAEARSSWLAAVEKDASCKPAHEALGHRLFEGKWLEADEFQKATGHVLRGGKWIPKEENEKLDQGWEYVDGKLLAPDDVKRAKGFVLRDGKWVLQKDLDEAAAKKAAFEREEKEAESKRHDPKDDAAIQTKYGSGWRLYIGKRYRLVTNVAATPEEFDKKLVTMMDGFWDTYCETFDVHPIQKTLHNIVVYNTHEEFDEAPGSVKGAYGVYQHGETFRPAVLWYMEKLRGSSFTSRHECGHQFVAHYLRQDGEGWFGEGIATTFECTGDVPFQDHLYRWEVIRGAVIDPGGFKLTDMITGKQADKGTIYCLGAATHKFFLEGADRAYRKAYQDYLKKGDTKSPEALAKAMGKSMDELQKEFEAWVKDMDSKRNPLIKRPDKK
ncbi:MAG: hypothetical protein K8T20_17250 [Planctomycetes bacterium]|nr:hypothetical protein [Planctomycetota bacterium]